eukprot:gene16498-44740_t
MERSARHARSRAARALPPREGKAGVGAAAPNTGHCRGPPVGDACTVGARSGPPAPTRVVGVRMRCGGLRANAAMDDCCEKPHKAVNPAALSRRRCSAHSCGQGYVITRRPPRCDGATPPNTPYAIRSASKRTTRRQCDRHRAGSGDGSAASAADTGTAMNRPTVRCGAPLQQRVAVLQQRVQQRGPVRRSPRRILHNARPAVPASDTSHAHNACSKPTFNSG